MTLASELTKSASRMLETTLKAEMQRTIVPALETMTRNEVKAALGSQIAKGISESITKSLPAEIEKLLLRPDVSNHMSRTFTAAVTPLIEKNVRDQIQKNLIPAYHQQASTMIEQLYTEINEEMVGLKKDIIAYQSETLKNHEVRVRSPIGLAAIDTQCSRYFMIWKRPSARSPSRSKHCHHSPRRTGHLVLRPHNTMHEGRRSVLPYRFTYANRAHRCRPQPAQLGSPDHRTFLVRIWAPCRSITKACCTPCSPYRPRLLSSKWKRRTGNSSSSMPCREHLERLC